MAEEIVVDAHNCLPKPRSFTHAQAASVSVGFMTAYHGLVHRGALRKGEWLLVTGAGGGMGLAAVQLGKKLGAKVIAAASSKEKLDAARRAGADHLVDYSSKGQLKDVRRVRHACRCASAPVLSAPALLLRSASRRSLAAPSRTSSLRSLAAVCLTSACEPSRREDVSH